MIIDEKIQTPTERLKHCLLARIGWFRWNQD